MTLSDKDLSTITNALMTAAERFRECAKTIGDDETIPAAGRARLVECFENQAKEASALFERMEDAQAVTFLVAR